MSQLYSDSIFWIEVDKIRPNPYQPRRDFDQEALEALAGSIRQYGILQPLVVTRREVPKNDGGIVVEYELIAGERRLRASKIAGVSQVPVVIRTGEDDNLMKLELAIIENLQREDLNPVDRAKAFQQFIDEFGYKHVEIAKKVGKSREYVSNSLRLLSLPEEILDALVEKKITEGHARPIMMLRDKPEEQMTLFKEVIYKKLTVRDAESIARRAARDKVRKKSRDFDPEILRMEKELTEQLGTRVHIEPREVGGKITIDFFSDEDLKNLLEIMNTAENITTEVDSDNGEDAKEEDITDDTAITENKNNAKIEETKEEKQDGHGQTNDISGTVAFGGLPKQEHKEVAKESDFLQKTQQDPQNSGLGDVLKNILDEEDNENERSEDRKGDEHKELEPQDPIKTESEPSSDVTPREQETMHEFVFGDEDDDFELPDTEGLRVEVDDILSTDDTSEDKDPFTASMESGGEKHSEHDPYISKVPQKPSGDIPQQNFSS